MILVNRESGKKLLLETLKYVDEVCKENNINYSLAAGTLLGAYRHNGFIPWDDDIDIAMSKKDFEKFINVFQRNSNCDFTLYYKNTVQDYPYEFAKVGMNGTKLVGDETGININKDYGIFLDIFTVESYSEYVSKEKRKLFRQFENSRKKVVIDSIYSKPLKVVFNIFRYISRILVPINLIDYIQRKYSQDDGLFIAYTFNHAHELMCKKEAYYPLSKIIFEGQEFPCPYDVPTVLRCEYGKDYMIPPKAKDRQVHYNEIYVAKDVLSKYELNAKD